MIPLANGTMQYNLAESRYFEALDKLPIPFLLINQKYEIVSANQTFCTMLNSPGPELIGKPCNTINASICGTPNCCFRRMEKNNLDAMQVVSEIDGTLFQVSSQLIRGATPSEDLIAITYSNWSEVQMLSSALRQSEAQYRHAKLFKDSLLANALYSFEVNLTQDSILCASLKQYPKQNIEKYKNYTSFLTHMEQALIDPGHVHAFKSLHRERLISLFNNGTQVQKSEFRHKTQYGRFEWLECTAILFHSIDDEDDNLYAYIIVRNIETRKRTEQELHKKAQYDTLTGLKNRESSVSDIEKKLLLSQQKDAYGALMMIDLNDFKQINDSYGHSMGDSVLAETARRMQSLFRSGDVVGRLGGDEFIVFLPAIKDRQTAFDRAGKLYDLILPKICALGTTCRVSASIGLAFSPDHGAAFQELYEHADIALYLAKKDKTRKYIVYEP
ncbi:sensor domain-containing diguanylate cyclase [Christensenellaceae bacterium OttesenSCG-928-K19]|nr:sensor domain-containing diguanylate cyclase [Christensenellaceae bacterium OttesenSCG-928-K19]